jgi:hypothetical protein
MDRVTTGIALFFAVVLLQVTAAPERPNRPGPPVARFAPYSRTGQPSSASSPAHQGQQPVNNPWQPRPRADNRTNENQGPRQPPAGQPRVTSRWGDGSVNRVVTSAPPHRPSNTALVVAVQRFYSREPTANRQSSPFSQEHVRERQNHEAPVFVLPAYLRAGNSVGLHRVKRRVIPIYVAGKRVCSC